MGFILTLLYVALALLSPKDLMPSLADYRVELLVVILALLVSAPRALDGKFFRIPQNYLLAGLFAAVFLSIAIGDHWPGGGFVALQKFLPAGVAFFLVVLNCHRVERLRMVVWLVAVIAGFYVVQGARAYYAGESNIDNVCNATYDQNTPTTKLTNINETLEVCSPLLEIIPRSDSSFAFRMRGLGFLKDPNEMAQLLVMLLPLLWTGWLKRRHFHNILFVLAPSALFVWGMYLTHSRGAVIALVVILMLALKDRVNLVATLLAGVLAFGVMIVLDFSGGREISVQASSNRFILWGDGLALFKSSPAFGVGYENFADANKGQTAHNSFIVCLAELGLFGYGFWVAILVFTILGLNSLLAKLKPVLNKAPPMDGDDEAPDASDLANVEYRRWAQALRLSLAGFLAAGFFLSRAYALTLYLTLGMAVAVVCLASEKEKALDEKPVWRQLCLSAAVGVATIALVYVALRIGNALALDKSGFLSQPPESFIPSAHASNEKSESSEYGYDNGYDNRHENDGREHDV